MKIVTKLLTLFTGFWDTFPVVRIHDEDNALRVLEVYIKSGNNSLGILLTTYNASREV
jgi:hypothetical protein